MRAGATRRRKEEANVAKKKARVTRERERERELARRMGERGEAEEEEEEEETEPAESTLLCSEKERPDSLNRVHRVQGK